MAKRQPLTLKVLESRIREMERTRSDDAAMVDLVRRGRIAEVETRQESMALILRLEARVSRLEDALREAKCQGEPIRVGADGHLTRRAPS